MTAEQYLRYPENIARRKVIDQNLIGEPYYIYLSLAHEYHGASLMRHFLEIPSETPYTIQAAQWSFPTAETLSRYESILDGRISMKTRTAAMITFENGKACLYDFDSEQYRSPIRSSHVRIQGVRGEIADDTIIWLNEDNHACRESLNTERRIVTTDSTNPNLSRFEEIVSIDFRNETLYEPPFGLCGLSQDETALASLLNDMGKYARDEGSAPYDLKESLQDAEMTLRLKESVR